MSVEIERLALTLFEQSIDLTEVERECWLDDVCEGKPELRARLEQLISADHSVDSNLVTGAALGDREEVLQPDQVGAYRITGTIGRGGMGVVYRGERSDGAFQRSVAIKFIQLSVYSDSVRQRFANERAILASMQHPNIAQLLDGGSYEGHPYLVMELIEGAPLGFEATRPLKTTLEVFSQVCSAIRYAHNKMVLHRDIKLNNILLTQEGTPKLLDFGIAKLSQSFSDNNGAVVDLTQGAVTPLTPNYSAPECLAGEPASIASDVYSLGVCLFELLNDKRPYDLAGMPTIKAHQQVLEASPVSRSGYRDLDQIVAVAMHKDASQRYDSVASLRADIQRFLLGEPVMARGDDWRYLTRRLVRRYRYPLIASGLGVIVLIAALTVAILGYVRAEQQTAIAAREARTSAATVGFLEDLLGSANPWEGAEAEATVDELLHHAETNLATTYAASPDVYAEVLSSLVDIQVGRGNFEGALALAEKAEKLRQENPQALAQQAANISRVLGSALQESGDLEAARDELMQSINFYLSADVVDWVSLASTKNQLGTVYMDLNQHQEAEKLLLEALHIYEDQAQNNPEAKASALNNLAALYSYQGELQRSVDILQLSLEELEKYDTNPVHRASLLGNMAGNLSRMKKFTAAEARYRQAIKLQRTAIPAEHPEAMVLTTSLANLYVNMKEPDKAIALMEPILAPARELPEDHYIRAYVENVAGTAYCETGDGLSGLPLAQHALAMRQRFFPNGHWSIYSAMSSTGLCAAQNGDLTAARTLLTQALTGLRELRGPEDELTRLAERRLKKLQDLERASL